MSSLPQAHGPQLHASFHELSRGSQPPPAAPALPALWRLGFRPFYLLAAAFAGLAIPLWMASFFGLAPALGVAWHAHEMVFGFAIAVIIGFLYTAGRNWTGLPTPRGLHLAALAGLWLAGRLAMLTLPALPATIIDLAFLPLAAWPLWQVLSRAGNRRNYFLVGLLGLLWLMNLLSHAAVLGWLAIDPLRPVQSAILVIVMLATVMGGRVIPMFSANAVPGLRPVVDARRDRITVGFLAAAILAFVLDVPGPALAGLCFAAGVAVLSRALGYLPLRTLRHPLLWVLHLSYAWIAAGLLLLGMAALNLVPIGAAFHALGLGAIGGLIIGMMTRTALGHTARALQAGPAETMMYLALHLGAVFRVLAALGGQTSTWFLLASAACWSLSFLLYVAVYGPRLLRPRLDGKDG